MTTLQIILLVISRNTQDLHEIAKNCYRNIHKILDLHKNDR